MRRTSGELRTFDPAPAAPRRPDKGNSTVSGAADLAAGAGAGVGEEAGFAGAAGGAAGVAAGAALWRFGFRRGSSGAPLPSASITATMV